jgi:hypothetical protein
MLAAARVSSFFITNLHLLTVGCMFIRDVPTDAHRDWALTTGVGTREEQTPFQYYVPTCEAKPKRVIARECKTGSARCQEEVCRTPGVSPRVQRRAQQSTSLLVALAVHSHHVVVVSQGRTFVPSSDLEREVGPPAELVGEGFALGLVARCHTQLVLEIV